MLGLGKLWSAIGTLTANLTALAQTVADVNQGLRPRLQLDQDGPEQPVLEHHDGEPVAATSRRGKRSAE